MRAAAMNALLVVLLGLAAAAAQTDAAGDAPAATATSPSPAPPPPADQDGAAGGWRLARGTYYGAPERVARAYDPTRGNGSFGILAYGSCGFTNSDGSLPFPRAAYAAPSDQNEDYPGSCGRCYAVRCKPGLVLNNERKPIRIIPPGSNTTLPTFEGDRFRPYLSAINPNVTDSRGRRWPGNPAEARGEVEVICAEGSPQLIIRIADSCPCTQVLPEGAPGVAKGGETRKQAWCCGGVQHFDMAYDAFERLAHPVYGVTMLEYRPVDCDTQAPLPFSPGYISRGAIYAGGTKPGWSWQSYKGSDFTYKTDVKTPAGSAATCATITPGGGLFFHCRECDRAGYQPFSNFTAVSFWIQSRSAGDASSAAAAGSNATANATAPTASLPLKIFIRGEKDNYCGAEPKIPALSPSATAAGGWARYVIPAVDFACYDAPAMTHIEFQSTAAEGGGDASFCLGELELQH